MTAIESTFAASFWQPKPLNGATEHDYTAAVIVCEVYQYEGARTAEEVLREGTRIYSNEYPPTTDRKFKGHKKVTGSEPIALAFC